MKKKLLVFAVLFALILLIGCDFFLPADICTLDHSGNNPTGLCVNGEIIWVDPVF